MSVEQSVTGVAGRYATALYELADEQKALDDVAGDLKNIRQMLAESPDLVRLVRSPVFSAEEQGSALDAILTRAGISPTVKNFVGVVVRNRRLFALSDMISGYLAILAAHRGEVTAEVTSAQPLNESHTSSLAAALRNVTGRDVQMDVKVDPELLGGLVVKVGSRMIDSSLRTKLNSLKIAMKEAG